MKNPEPLISVLMPMYNEEKHVEEAIESILNQTYKNYEFLIIDDGSTDHSEAIIKSFQDTRIRYIKNEKNLGISNTLNKGIELARGKYIFRMDADDISLPNRMEKQVAFMEANETIGACSSNLQFIGTEDSIFTYHQHDKEIRTNLLTHPSLSNGAMIMRKSVLEKLDKWFDPTMDSAEDHDLWERMSHHTTFANLPDVLYRYRMHENNGHLAIPERLFNAVFKIRCRVIAQHLNRTLSSHELKILETAFYRKEGSLKGKKLLEFHRLLSAIYREIAKKPQYSKKVAKQVLTNWWLMQMKGKSKAEKIRLLLKIPPLYFHWMTIKEKVNRILKPKQKL